MSQNSPLQEDQRWTGHPGQFLGYHSPTVKGRAKTVWGTLWILEKLGSMVWDRILSKLEQTSFRLIKSF